jgi:hypothetical protein
MLNLETFYYIFRTALGVIILGFIIAHFISSWVLKKTPVKLDSASWVFVIGGCMGIGRQICL